MSETLTNADIAEGMVEAVQSFDLEKLLGYIAEDAVVYEPQDLPYGGLYNGPQGFTELLGKLAERLELEITNVDLYENETGFVLRFDAKFTSRATGRSVDTCVTEVDTIVDGKVTKFDVFYKDPVEISELYSETG